MSIRIEPDELVAAHRGREFVYLITRGEDRAHVVALRCDVSAGRVTMTSAGRSSRANIGDGANVTLVWPPSPFATEHPDYSIVVDGTASMDDETVVVSVTAAVFHRPAP